MKSIIPNNDMAPKTSRHLQTSSSPQNPKLIAWVSALACALLAFTGCDRSPKPEGAPASAPVPGQVATITAEPNPVPAGPGNGITTITWDTGDGSPGEVYVSVDGGDENIFSKRTQGSEKADWIKTGSTFVFRLYLGTERSKLLGEVKVTRSEK